MEKRSENKALNKLSIGFGVLFLIASILTGLVSAGMVLGVLIIVGFFFKHLFE
jgi:hypothetical protein